MGTKLGRNAKLQFAKHCTRRRPPFLTFAIVWLENSAVSTEKGKRKSEWLEDFTITRKGSEQLVMPRRRPPLLTFAAIVLERLAISTAKEKKKSLVPTSFSFMICFSRRPPFLMFAAIELEKSATQVEGRKKKFCG